MTVKERIQEYKKKKDENSGEQQRNDRSVKYRISEFKLNKYDTNALQENVKKSLTSAESIFKGWADQATVNDAISNLQNTKQSLADYRNLVSDVGKNISDVDSLLAGLDSTMKDLDAYEKHLTKTKSVYGSYNNAEAYNSARNEAQFLDMFAPENFISAAAAKQYIEKNAPEYALYFDRYKDHYMTLDEVQAEIDYHDSQYSGLDAAHNWAYGLTNDIPIISDSDLIFNNYADSGFIVPAAYHQQQKQKYENLYTEKKDERILKKLKNVSAQGAIKYIEAMEETDLPGLWSKLEDLPEEASLWDLIDDATWLGTYGFDADYGARRSIDVYLETMGLDPDYVYGLAERVKGGKIAESFNTFAKDFDVPVLSDALSIVGSLVSILGTADIVAQNLSNLGEGVDTRIPVNYNTIAQLPGQYASTIRGQRSEQLGDTAGFFYNTGMSVADFLASRGIGKIAAGTSSAKTANNVASALLAGSASNSAMQDAHKRGATDFQALTYGLAAGVNEMIFERFSLDQLDALKASAGKGAGTFVKNLAKQGFTEGMEELGTDLANALVDNMVNGELSQLSLSVHSYMDQGLSEEEAKQKAALDFGEQLALSFAGGSLSGGVMGGGSQIASRVSANRAVKNIGSDFIKANTTNELLNLAKTDYAQNKEIQTLVSAVEKNISEKTVGALAQAIEKTALNDRKKLLHDAYVDSFRQALEGSELTAEQINRAAENFTKKAQGKQVTLSSQEQALFDQSDAVRETFENVRNGTIANLTLSGEQQTRNEEIQNRLDALYKLTETEEQKAARAEAEEVKNLYKVSYDGSFRTEAGESVQVGEIVEVKKGKVTVNTDKGQMSLDQLSMPDENTALLYSYAADMPTAQARAFVENYQPGQDLAQYANGFEMYYAYGVAGIDAGKINVSLSNLTAAQKTAAYSQGVKDSGKYKAEQNVVDARKKNGKKSSRSGSVDTSALGFDVKNVDKQRKLSRHQKAEIKVAKSLAEKLGLQIVFYNSKVNAKGDFQGDHGYYSKAKNTVYLDINAGRKNISDSMETAILATLSHELTHQIRVQSPALYAELQKAVLEELKGINAEALQRLVNDAMSKDSTLTAEDALEEVVANACEDMLRNDTALRSLLESHKTLGEKIKAFVKDFLNDIKNLLKDLSSNQEISEESALLRSSQEAYNRIAELWAKGLLDASEAGQFESDDAKPKEDFKHKNRNTNQVAFIEDKYFSRQVDHWKDLNRTSYITVGEIVEKSPLNLVGIPAGTLYFDVSKLQEAMTDHEDHLSVDIIKKVPALLSNPIVITEYRPGEGTNTANVYGELFYHGRPITVGVVATLSRGKTVISKIRTIHAKGSTKTQITDESILYLNENKKETKKWFQARRQHVPVGGTKFGLIRIIPLFEQNVNPLTENFSEESFDKDVKRRARDNSDEISVYRSMLSELEAKAETAEDRKQISEWRKSVDTLEDLSARQSEAEAALKDKIPDVWESYQNKKQALALEKQYQRTLKAEIETENRDKEDGYRDRVKDLMADREASFAKSTKLSKEVLQLQEDNPAIQEYETLEKRIGKVKADLSSLRKTDPVGNVRTHAKAEQRLAEQERRLKEKVRQQQTARKISEINRDTAKVKDRLVSMLKNPTSSRYVPKNLIGGIVSIVNKVNEISSVLRDNKVQDRMQALADAKEDLRLAKERGIEWKISSAEKQVKEATNRLATDEHYQKTATDEIARFEKAIGALEKNNKSVYEELLPIVEVLDFHLSSLKETPVSQLTKEQVIDLNRAVRLAEKVVKSETKSTMQGKDRDLAEHRNALNREITAQKKKSRKAQAFGEWALDFALPITFFEEMSGYKKDSEWMKVYQELNDAQTRYQDYSMISSAMFADLIFDKNGKMRKEYKALHDPKNLVDLGMVTLEDGKKVPVTRDMMCGIYLNTFDSDNMYHILQGGLTVPAADLYTEGKYDKAFSGTEAKTAIFTASLTADLDEAKGSMRETLYLKESDIPEYLAAGERQNKNRQKRYAAGEKIIISSDEELSSFVNRSISENKNEMAAYGRVSDALAEQIREASNSKINVFGAYLELLSDDVRHAIEGHETAKESGDVDMPKDDLVYALQRVNEAQVVYAKQHSDGSQRVKLAIPTNNGVMLLVELFSKSAGSLRLKTAWQSSWEKFAKKYGSNSSSAGSKSSSISARDYAASNSSISQTEQKVKRGDQNPFVELVELEDDAKRNLCEFVMNLFPQESTMHKQAERALSAPDPDYIFRNLKNSINLFGTDANAAAFDYRYNEYKKRRRAVDRAQERLSDRIRETCRKEMTAWEIEFCERAQGWFNGTAKEQLNDATLRTYGFEKAKKPNYYPSRVDRNYTEQDIVTYFHSPTVAGYGAMKSRIKSPKPLLLEGMSDVLQREIDRTSKYAAFLEPITNVKKLLGGDVTGGKNLLASVEETKGKHFRVYMENLIRDLESPGRKKDDTEKVFAKIRGNYARAIFTGNLKTGVGSLAAYPVGAHVLGWKPLLKALNVTQRVNRELIDTYSSAFWFRDKTGIIAAMANTDALGKIFSNEFVKKLNFVEGFDNLVVGRFWIASEYYVDKHYPELKKGSEEQIKKGESEYYRKVAEVFRRVIEETEANYSTMQRVQALRDGGEFIQNLTMFKTANYQNSNIVVSSIRQYLHYKADFAAGRNGVTSTDVKTALKGAANALATQIAQNVVYALATNLVLAAMSPGKYDDDDELEAAQELGIQIAADFLEGFMVLPGAGLFSEILGSIAFDQWYNGVSTLSVEAFDSARDSFRLAASELISAVDDGNWNNVPKRTLNLAEKISTLFGIPFSNAVKVAKVIPDWLKTFGDLELPDWLKNLL